MYSIKKYWFIILFFLSIIPIIALGLYSSSVLGTINIANDNLLKYYEENLIYLMIIFVILITSLFVITYMKSRKLLKELDKVVTLTYQSGINTDISKSLKRMGELGRKISNLTYHLNKLNEMKTLKISSLGSMNNFFVDNIELKVLVLTTTGNITQCSKKLLINFDAEKRSFLGRNINEITNNFTWAETISDLTKLRKSVVRNNVEFIEPFKYKGDFVLYPIFNSNNELSNIVGILEDDEITGKLAIKTDQIKADRSNKINKILKSIIGKNKK